MDYTELFTPHHIAVLAEWLEEKSELLLQIELPHSGGSGTAQTVRSFAEIRRAVAAIDHPEVEIMVWRQRTLAEFESDEILPDEVAWIEAHPEEVMYFAVRKQRTA